MSGYAAHGRSTRGLPGSPLGSGSPHSSLRVPTLTSARTWALSSPHLRPGFSHQSPSLPETRMSQVRPLYQVPSLRPGCQEVSPLYSVPSLRPGCQEVSPLYSVPSLRPGCQEVSPLYSVPSLRPGCQEVRPCLFCSSYPRVSQDQQPGWASLGLL